MRAFSFEETTSPLERVRIKYRAIGIRKGRFYSPFEQALNEKVQRRLMMQEPSPKALAQIERVMRQIKRQLAAKVLA